MTETPTHLDLTSLSDAHLVELLRGGEERAYAALWSRHYPAARKAARAVTSSHDPEDLAQEAFTRIFAAIKNGKGPTDNFRAYLYATLRSVSMAWSAKLEPTVDLSTQENLLITDSDIASLTEDKRLTLSAFRNLPEDWRTVLWYSEIEGMTPAEIAPIMGLNPRAVSALAFRAREGLRDSWLQAHIPTTSQANSEECQWTEQHIASYARGSITTRRKTRIENHLKRCNDCSLLLAELQGVSQSLRGILLPLVLGVSPVVLSQVLPLTAAGTVGTATTSGPLGRTRDWASSNQGAVLAVIGILVVAGAVGAAFALSNPNRGPVPTPTAQGNEAITGGPTAPPTTTPPTTEPIDDELDPPEEQPPSSEVASESSVERPTGDPRPRPTAEDPSDNETQRPRDKDKDEDKDPVTDPDDKPTQEPEQEPSEEPTPDPSEEPTEEPQEPQEPETGHLELTAESDPVDVSLMPRFSGIAPVGSDIQVFDAANPTIAVSERVTVAASGSLATSVSEEDEPELAAWTVDVSSTAPTGGGLRYVIRNFIDGEVVAEKPVSTTYTVSPMPEDLFKITNLEPYGTGPAVQNGGSVEVSAPLEDFTANFKFGNDHGGYYSFYLNGVPRPVRSDVPGTVEEPGQMSWVTNSVPFQVGVNTIGVRVAEPIPGTNDVRFGPARELFRFTITITP
ncbi:sigma-70 family RNA polymerase sigma factor [Populibacterium corticicola]|uniref:Sigma-70 family RNA polymerase sigma factor n=1 Tax=Populibacterium corticicola TaxID=1812826 RepID=A0ABW5XEL5_9MICO